MRYERAVVLNAIDASVAATNSSVIDASNLFAASCQVVAVGAGTPTGTLKLQFSNDDSPSVAGNPSNWVDIPSATVSIAGAGTYGIAKIDLAYQYIRAVYTKTSGTGTITAVISGKGF